MSTPHRHDDRRDRRGVESPGDGSIRAHRRTPIPTGPHIVLNRDRLSERFIARVRRQLDKCNGTLEVVTDDDRDAYPRGGDWPD